MILWKKVKEKKKFKERKLFKKEKKLWHAFGRKMKADSGDLIHENANDINCNSYNLNCFCYYWIIIVYAIYYFILAVKIIIKYYFNNFIIIGKKQ